MNSLHEDQAIANLDVPGAADHTQGMWVPCILDGVADATGSQANMACCIRYPAGHICSISRAGVIPVCADSCAGSSAFRFLGWTRCFHGPEPFDSAGSVNAGVEIPLLPLSPLLPLPPYLVTSLLHSFQKRLRPSRSDGGNCEKGAPSSGEKIVSTVLRSPMTTTVYGRQEEHR